MEDHQFFDDAGGAGSDADIDPDDDLEGRTDGFDHHGNDRRSSIVDSREIKHPDASSQSDSSDEDDETSTSTVEASSAAKASIEKYYKNLFTSMYEREQRRVRYEQKMDQIGLGEGEKEERRKKLDLIETQFLRARRIKLKKDTFQNISVIGRGSFGEVRLVQMKGTKKLFAMKKLKKSKMIARNQVEHVKKERDALADLNDFYKQNPWVVRLYYSFQDAMYLYLIMEYVPGGDLMTQLIKYEKFSEKAVKFYLAEIVMAVASIHRFNYIHRDIKPDNILLDKKGHIKLSDFGLCTALTTDDKMREMQHKYATVKKSSVHGESSEVHVEHPSSSSHLPNPDLLAPPQLHSMSRSNSGTSLSDMDKDGSLTGSNRFNSWRKKRRELAFSEVGTPDYMAPEVLDPDGNGYGKECDWWSVGVIMFEMIAGFPAFYSSSESGSAATYRKIFNWKETLEEVLAEVPMSNDARDLICRFLTNREDRIGTRGIEEIQKHPFFSGIDWDNIRNSQAPIIPHIEHATDTSNFPVEEQDDTSESEEEDTELERSYPLYRGRRLRQTDIPFIGFTYKNLAAVPQLIRSPAKPGSRAKE